MATQGRGSDPLTSGWWRLLHRKRNGLAGVVNQTMFSSSTLASATAKQDFLFEPIFEAGINFRSTAAYVRDGYTEVYCLGSSYVYPINQRGLTFGWVTTVGDMDRDRDNTLDRRLAGQNQKTNDGTQVAGRLDVPSIGLYSIGLAIGDATSSQGYQEVTILDDATTLFSIVDTGGTAAPNFDDAFGTDFAPAAWVTGNVLKTAQPIVSGILRFLTGSAGAQAGSTTIAHLYVKLESLLIIPEGIASTVAWGSPTVTQTVASQSITPTALASTLAWGSLTVTPGDVSVSPTALASTLAFGTETISLYVTPNGIASSAAFGVLSTSIYVSPTALSSTLAFGSSDLLSTASILATGRASSLAFGAPETSIYVTPTSIGSTLAFGSPTASGALSPIAPTGTASTIAFGSPAISIYVTPNGGASALAFGAATISPGAVTFSVLGIGSTLGFGSPLVSPGAATIAPSGSGSSAALGSPTVIPGDAHVLPTGKATSRAFGSPTVAPGSVSVSLSGRASTIAFGAPSILNGTITPVSGIDSGLRIGEPTIRYVAKPTGIKEVKPKQRILENALQFTQQENYIFEPEHELLKKFLDHVRILCTEDMIPRRLTVVLDGALNETFGMYAVRETGSGVFVGMVKSTESGLVSISPGIPNEIRLLAGDGVTELTPPKGWKIVEDESVQARYNIGVSPNWKAAVIVYVGI